MRVGYLPDVVVQGPSENSRKSQDIIDLVRIIRPSGGHDGGSAFFRFFRHDFRNRITHRENYRVLGHHRNVFGFQKVRSAYPDENVRSFQGVGQSSHFLFLIRYFGNFNFYFGLVFHPAFIDDPFAVQDQDVFRAIFEKQFHDRHSRRPGSGNHYADFFHIFLHDFERVDEPGQNDDRRPVLVVMEHRDSQSLLESFLDFETARGGNVFQIDPTESRCDRLDYLNNFLGNLRVQNQGHRIHSPELFEKQRLPLHHRKTRFRTDVSQPQNRASVGNDGYGVFAYGIFVGKFLVFCDRLAHVSHSRRIQNRQSFLRQFLFRFYLDLPSDFFGQFYRFAHFRKYYFLVSFNFLYTLPAATAPSATAVMI